MRKIPLSLGVAAVLLAPSVASAFCGFYVAEANKPLYNTATQVVLMREGTRTVLSMQNNYEGPPEKFAVVIPVPVVLQKATVKTLARELFAHVDQLDSPRLVEYWEKDPCRVDPPMEEKVNFGPGAVPMTARAGGRGSDLGVTVEAQFTAGEYEIVILSAKDSTGLDTWLKQEKYAIPEGAEPVLRPYVAAGSKFFVAKVDPQKVVFDEHHQAMLSPLRFFYDTEAFSLPIRLGLLNAKDDQDLIVHILSRGKRFEAANYENVTIPTNLDVKDDARQDFGGRYAALFDDTVAKHPKSVVTEYSWDASTCDPCPGPALSFSDIATLGGDVIDGLPGTGTGPGAAPGPTPFRGVRGGGGWTLTRLHARYNKTSLGDDLVFRAAPAIVGGREIRDASGKLEEDAKPASTNNFQARYAIRHPWTGPIECASPQRGRWGGPPAGHTGSSSPAAATQLGFAKRDKALLASFIVPGGPPPVAVASASATPAPGASAKPASSGGGCGSCSTSEGSASQWPLAIGGAFGLAALLRRRRDRRPR